MTHNFWPHLRPLGIFITQQLRTDERKFQVAGYGLVYKKYYVARENDFPVLFVNHRELTRL